MVNLLIAAKFGKPQCHHDAVIPVERERVVAAPFTNAMPWVMVQRNISRQKSLETL